MGHDGPRFRRRRHGAPRSSPAGREHSGIRPVPRQSWRPRANAGEDLKGQTMFNWMYDLPTWATGLLFSLGALALGLGGMFLVRPFFHRWIHKQDRTNEMVSLSMASFSVFYGILLGMVAVGVYANYSSTVDSITREASSLAALYSDTSALPAPHRAVLLGDLRDYAKVTIEKDWPAQNKGEVPTSGTDHMTTYMNDFGDVHPTARTDEIAYAEAFGQFEKLVELRSTRLANINSGIPAILWWVLWIGASLSIGIVWMLDMEAHIHGILTAVLSMFLGIVIFLIADMDKPLRSADLASPAPYQLVYANLMKAR
jgi:hypothetical protein